MLTLKMSVLKLLKKKKPKKTTKQKQCVALTYYKCISSLFGRDDTKQAKSLIFTVVSQAEQSPKVQGKKAKEDVIRT